MITRTTIPCSEGQTLYRAFADDQLLSVTATSERLARARAAQCVAGIEAWEEQIDEVCGLTDRCRRVFEAHRVANGTDPDVFPSTMLKQLMANFAEGIEVAIDGSSLRRSEIKTLIREGRARRRSDIRWSDVTDRRILPIDASIKSLAEDMFGSVRADVQTLVDVAADMARIKADPRCAAVRGYEIWHTLEATHFAAAAATCVRAREIGANDIIHLQDAGLGAPCFGLAPSIPETWVDDKVRRFVEDSPGGRASRTAMFEYAYEFGQRLKETSGAGAAQ